MPAGQPERIRMGEFAARSLEEAPHGLSIHGLGSCVAVYLHASRHRLGGLAHIMLPEPMDGSPLTCPGKFAPTAVAGLLDAMLRRGARREDLLAKVVGGAHMFALGTARQETLGERNIRAALQTLEQEKIHVAGMDVGGSCGRTLVACIGTGMVRVTSLRRQPAEV